MFRNKTPKEQNSVKHLFLLESITIKYYISLYIILLYNLYIAYIPNTSPTVIIVFIQWQRYGFTFRIKSVLNRRILFVTETASPLWCYYMPGFCRITELDFLSQIY